jgi:hypothetical protein
MIVFLSNPHIYIIFNLRIQHQTYFLHKEMAGKIPSRKELYVALSMPEGMTVTTYNSLVVKKKHTTH